MRASAGRERRARPVRPRRPGADARLRRRPRLNRPSRAGRPMSACCPARNCRPTAAALNNLAGRAWCVTAQLGQIGALADAYIADLSSKNWLAAGGDENRVVLHQASRGRRLRRDADGRLLRHHQDRRRRTARLSGLRHHSRRRVRRAIGRARPPLEPRRNDHSPYRCALSGAEGRGPCGLHSLCDGGRSVARGGAGDPEGPARSGRRHHRTGLSVFSDPMAEGPPIQKAAIRGLAAGFGLRSTMDLAQANSARATTPRPSC